jgi:choline kinase
MKTIIIAAGKATRLLPLTKDTPHCLLKVGGKAILDKLVEYIKKSGVSDITVITGHLSEKVERYCKSIGVKTLFNPFYDVSGMALTLWVAKDELKEGFIMLYSDVLFDPKIMSSLLKNKGDICLAIKKDGLREEAEKVVEKDGLIKDVSKVSKEKENGEFIGIAKFSDLGAKKFIEELDNIAKADLGASFIYVVDNLIKKGEKIAAYDIGAAQFIDIDFPDDLEKAEKLFS